MLTNSVSGHSAINKSNAATVLEWPLMRSV